MQYIVAVAETGSFSKAAELCNADQSTVSQQVKLFEEKLGVSNGRRKGLVIADGDDCQSAFASFNAKGDFAAAPLAKIKSPDPLVGAVVPLGPKILI